MKILLKSLIIWLMLVAIPFQGFASATMLVCAPMQSAPQLVHKAEAPVGHHDHHLMSGAAEKQTPHHHGAGSGANVAPTDSDNHTAADHHAGGKCHSCASCCVGAAIAPSYALRVLAEVQHVASFPFEPGLVASVDLAFPERPPQHSLA